MGQVIDVEGGLVTAFDSAQQATPTCNAAAVDALMQCALCSPCLKVSLFLESETNRTAWLTAPQSTGRPDHVLTWPLHV